jgi:hypothetical protein
MVPDEWKSLDMIRQLLAGTIAGFVGSIPMSRCKVGGTIDQIVEASK